MLVFVKLWIIAQSGRNLSFLRKLEVPSFKVTLRGNNTMISYAHKTSFVYEYDIWQLHLITKYKNTEFIYACTKAIQFMEVTKFWYRIWGLKCLIENSCSKNSNESRIRGKTSILTVTSSLLSSLNVVTTLRVIIVAEAVNPGCCWCRCFMCMQNFAGTKLVLLYYCSKSTYFETWIFLSHHTVEILFMFHHVN